MYDLVQSAKGSCERDTAQHMMRSVFRTYMYRVRSVLTIFFTYIYVDRAQRVSVDVWSGICQNVLVCMYLKNRTELTVSKLGTIVSMLLNTVLWCIFIFLQPARLLHRSMVGVSGKYFV